MTTWGTAPDSDNPSSPPISVVIAGPPDATPRLYAALLADGRFNVLATTITPADLPGKLALHPDAVLVDGRMFPGPQSLVEALTRFHGTAHVLLPTDVGGHDVSMIEQVPCVVRVQTGDGVPTDVAAHLFDAATARRRAAHLPTNGHGPPRPPGQMIGHRRVAVWSLQGGVGKSTIAASLALEAASRQLPTLLVGLGAPDTVPLALGLHADPNLQHWQATPTPAGLRSATQKAETLDVLAGFVDPLALSGYLPDALEGAGSLPRLADCAAQAGYAVVILDVSAPELAAAALATANTLVLVGLATLPGILAAVEAVRLAADALAGQHRIPPQAMHLVLNRTRASTLTPEEVVRTAADQRRGFPPLAAAIPDDPAVEEALNRRRPAYYYSDPLSQAARTLGDLLLAAPAARTQPVPPGKVYTLGPVRVRV